MNDVIEIDLDEEIEVGSEQLPSSNYFDVTLEEKHWYDNPKYNDGLHYTPQNALSQSFEFCLTNGGRSNGKTTGWQMQMIDDFFNYGMIYGKIIRKYTYDSVKNLSWFTNIVQEYVKEVWHHEIVAVKFDYYLVPLECRPDRYLPREPRQKKFKLNYKLLCKSFNLALENDDKSHDYSYIKRLIFEEYSLINQYDYLPEEVEHFMSLLSTINRDRNDLSVVFIGNTISKHNPYFDWLGININKLQLKTGEYTRLICKDYDDGARIFVEIIPSVYGEVIECPRILRVGNNEIAVTGEWSISEDVYSKDYDSFISGLPNKIFNFVIKTDNKLYYHYTCNYKNNTFNVITNRIKNIKSNGLIYEYDVNSINRIMNGTLSKAKLQERLNDVINFETIFSDDEIEYKYKKLINRRI